jgi:transposase
MRRLADLPAQGKPVKIRIQVRRFFCGVASCPRRIFAERFPGLTVTYGRTSTRLCDAHGAIGRALGGEPGSRLCARLAIPTSPDTLLRRVRQLPLPSSPAVRVLGVDDWAMRRGQRYGTLLCDLERHRPVDLLPERSAESLCRWLRDHPQVEVIARDRADDYIKGATQGAPQAIQIADRWHLLKNLRETLGRVVERHQADLKAKAAQPEEISQTNPRPSLNGEEEVRGPSWPSKYRQRQRERRQHRLARYEAVKEFHNQGMTLSEIAHRLSMNPQTVRRFARAQSFPERAPRRTPRRTDRFQEYLRRRWADGCHNAQKLFNEIKGQGFDGSYYMVARRVALWRRRSGPSDRVSKDRQLARKGRLSPRRITWLLLKPEEKLGEAERKLRRYVEDSHVDLRRAAELSREFATMVHDRRAESWSDWIDKARGATMPIELTTFARGLLQDEQAVRAALTSEWSNGQLEGQVNRLKTLKRQMYGRANFDLLRRRYLLAA